MLSNKIKTKHWFYGCRLPKRVRPRFCKCYACLSEFDFIWIGLSRWWTVNEHQLLEFRISIRPHHHCVNKCRGFRTQFRFINAAVIPFYHPELEPWPGACWHHLLHNYTFQHVSVWWQQITSTRTHQHFQNDVEKLAGLVSELSWSNLVLKAWNCALALSQCNE